MRGIVLLVALAACSRGRRDAPEPDPPPPWREIEFEECGFAVMAPGEPVAIGLQLTCYPFPPQAAVIDPAQAFEIGVSAIRARVDNHGDTAAVPLRKPTTIAGYPALGLRFAMDGGRATVGVLVLVDRRLGMIWAVIDPARADGLDEADLGRVIASFAPR
ncbi:MAG: hypothetical protein K8W52_45040 [Deltaproteobacteria bacterium]|nr:hypothetical protein [Deltaproteobacteria bacterium]